MKKGFNLEADAEAGILEMVEEAICSWDLDTPEGKEVLAGLRFLQSEEAEEERLRLAQQIEDEGNGEQILRGYALGLSWFR